MHALEVLKRLNEEKQKEFDREQIESGEVEFAIYKSYSHHDHLFIRASGVILGYFHIVAYADRPGVTLSFHSGGVATLSPGEIEALQWERAQGCWNLPRIFERFVL